jgi:DNA uptake protein ComE-like DNA-binding protein
MKTGRQRGSILLAVMVLITLAALVGTTVLYRADAQRGSAANAMEHAQLRSLAWSGVQAAMAELSSQRGALMQGGAPSLTASWDLYTGTVHGNVRLAPLGTGDVLTVSEGGKLDLNASTAPMLARLPGVGDALAGKIVAARGAGFGSAEELAGVEGVTADLLFGGGAADRASREGAGDAVGPSPLLGLTTVFSFDPNVTDGVGPTASGDELARVNISGGWSDDLAAELQQRMSPQAVAALQAAIKTTKPAHDSDIISALRTAKEPVDLWGEVLGGVTTSDDQYRSGRVDLNSASSQVLACVPGIDQGAAAKIVEARGRLDEPSRQRVTWPLKEGILKEDQFQSAADWLTTRSLQWRVRVEARMERGAAASHTASAEEEEESAPGMVWEAVIDVSGPRARVAYLRDVTYLPALAQRAREQEKTGTSSSAEVAAVEAPVQVDELPEAPGAPLNMDKFRPSTQLRTEKLKIDSGLKLEGMKGSGRLKMDTDLKLVGSEGDSSKGAGAQGQDGAAVDGPSGAADKPTAPTTPKDRRIGRWRGPSKE